MLRRSDPRGFTLIELLIVIAIIGIIAALIVPNLIDAMQKGKQKRTMGDLKIVGTAMMSWLTDQVGGAAAAGQTTIDLATIPPIDAEDLEEILVPAYIQKIPEADAWGEPYDYHLKVTDAHGLLVLGTRSLGRDRLPDGSEYTIGAFEPTDYDQDLVWVDGGFVRWPEKAAAGGGGS